MINKVFSWEYESTMTFSHFPVKNNRSLFVTANHNQADCLVWRRSPGLRNGHTDHVMLCGRRGAREFKLFVGLSMTLHPFISFPKFDCEQTNTQFYCSIAFIHSWNVHHHAKLALTVDIQWGCASLLNQWLSNLRQIIQFPVTSIWPKTTPILPRIIAIQPCAGRPCH